MRVLISKSKANGVVKAPSSKSYTIRSLMCAALAEGQSRIVSPLESDDTIAARECLSQLGVQIIGRDNLWLVEGGHLHAPENVVFCRDSAATLRFLAAICSVIPGRFTLSAGRSLAKRPVGVLVRALQQLGVECSANGELPPVHVNGGTLRGGVVYLPGDVSSQYVSALLMAAPLAKERVLINLTTPLESSPYVSMTVDCMNKFGVTINMAKDMQKFEVSPQKYIATAYNVEGDWTSASYFLGLGALAGEVTVTNLDIDTFQADKKIIDILMAMGADIRVNGEKITVRESPLKAVEVDLSDCIDLLPTVAVLAAVARGTSLLYGIGRARIKESDRIRAVRADLERMNVTVKEGKDSLSITGTWPSGAVIDSFSDHRIAMAFGILGTLVGQTEIEGAECVDKTYPDFWSVLKNIGGKLEFKNG